MGNTLNTSHSSIFDYWKNKAITSDGTVIEDDFVTVEDEMIRHNVTKLAFHIFSYLL